MILPIVRYGDPVLRAKGQRITKVDARVRALVADMLDPMSEAHGVGLAAQQIGEAVLLTVTGVGAAANEVVTRRRRRS